MVRVVSGADDSLLVDISDALSEKDRVRFTVQTRTKLAHFAKPVMSVVRQHEEFIWLHDCLEDNDQYAGYIIPPPPPKPDFDASREKLQRLGESENSLTKEEFAKMKQELEAEYLAIFKKTVAMHEIFLQRLATHSKFRQDDNFKVFLEYENELAVRCKSKKERLAGSIQNIGKSLSEFVITGAQMAAATTAGTSLLVGQQPSKLGSKQDAHTIGNNYLGDIQANSDISQFGEKTSEVTEQNLAFKTGDQSNNGNNSIQIENRSNHQPDAAHSNNSNGNTIDSSDNEDNCFEQYFDRERVQLALYLNSIREAANQADKVTQLQKCVADSYLYISQQLVKLAGIEVVPITAQTKDSSSFVACTLPSLTLPNSRALAPSPTNVHFESSPTRSIDVAGNSSSTSGALGLTSSGISGLDTDDDGLFGSEVSLSESNDKKTGDKPSLEGKKSKLTSVKLSGGCANDHTSEGLKQLLLNVSDYFEHARKVEARIASDEDLKLTDTFLYYKRETNAAQDLILRRYRFLAEYETATRNLEKARQKGRTQMQYADVIQKQAKENLISISKLAKQELTDYKKRRVAAFKKAFSDLVELELKHLHAHSHIIINCLNVCRGLQQPPIVSPVARSTTRSTGSGATQPAQSTSSSEPDAELATRPPSDASTSTAASSLPPPQAIH